METFNLRRVALCILLCAFAMSVAHGQEKAKPRPEDIKLVKSTLAKLADTKDPYDFIHAQNAIKNLIRHDRSRNRFAHTVLVAKLLVAVTKRLEAFPDQIESNEDLSVILSLNAGNSFGSGPVFDEQSDRKLGIKRLSPKDSLSPRDNRLKRDLERIEVGMVRTLHDYYRTFFSGVDDLKRILEKATNDKNRQTETFDRLIAEFKVLDRQHDIIGGKLRRN